MKLNLQLKSELARYEKFVANAGCAASGPTCEADVKSKPRKPSDRTGEKVVGGDILWKPVDRAAAMLLAKAHWLSQPPQVAAPKPKPEKKQSKPKKELKHMNSSIAESGVAIQANGKYTSKSGLTVTMVNGEPMLRVDEMNALICEQIEKLPRETRPSVQQAEDARKVIGELLHGIGGEMEKFQANSKAYLDDIRQTRFAVVRECAEMTKELKEVRQFFIGNDYKEQVTRLREFVDLCERLQQLKKSGFLDSVADTMLRLADDKSM